LQKIASVRPDVNQGDDDMPMFYRERGLFELYADDPERADALVFERRTGATRRGFLSGSGLATMTAMIGAPIAMAELMPGGLIPAAFAQTAKEPKLLKMDGKAELVVLGDRPLVAETPAWMLDDDVTPTEKFYIRNNGTPPEAAKDPDAWEIVIDGEVTKPLKITVGELNKKFKKVSYVLQLECGGNGRSAFEPPARGNQWTNGGVGCARWGGVALGDVLKAAGLKPSAKYTAHYGADVHLSGNPDTPTLSRGVRLAKAMDQYTLIAFEMNGKPIPNIHGGPVRLIVPGWAGSASHKWLKRVWIRDKVHDGPGMKAPAYSTPTVPGVPGDPKFDVSKMKILESMPVRSVITNVKDGQKFPAQTRELALRGKAWAGDNNVTAVHVSADYGQTWTATQVSAPANRYAWQKWAGKLKLANPGYYELWVRATDSSGKSQAMAAPFWNPQGYGANVIQRVRVLVEA
jgi:DMSO/TMAO reductase YedYZ molybdopterin-dependent catalytic subunit